MSDEQTALAPLTQYPIIAVDAVEVNEIIKTNIGASGLNLFDMDRCAIPSGGGMQWELPTLEGDVEHRNHLDGVIIGFIDTRAYYEHEFGEGESGPPDCMSIDLVHGQGNPGGPCHQCPYNDFGSDKNGQGKGKACKEQRILLLATQDSVMPLVIKLPPTSLKVCRSFFMRLTNKMLRYYHVRVRIELEKTKNDKGIWYSEARFKLTGPVPDKLREQFTNLAKSFEKLLDYQSPPVASEPSPDPVEPMSEYCQDGDNTPD